MHRLTRRNYTWKSCDKEPSSPFPSLSGVGQVLGSRDALDRLTEHRWIWS